jgi:uncharacterized protein (TIGR03435 family)
MTAQAAAWSYCIEMRNCAVCLLIVLPALASAQEKRASGQSPLAFDVVSIKPTPPGRRDQVESYCANGGRFISHGTPLLWSIKWAYGLKDYQMSDGWPAWLNAFDTYDIEAQTEARVTEDQCKSMVQALFEERFELRMSRRTKTVSAYALVVGKNGPKLFTTGRVIINGAVKQATSERDAPAGWTMERLANYLAAVRAIHRPVVNQTKLSGMYGFGLNYSTMDGDDRPDISTALQEQLGLKLQAVKAPIEIWFVDRVEKPGGN